MAAVQLHSSHLATLVRLAQALIDQERARVLVPPRQRAPGFWFGGGNLIQDEDGAILLVGRYRDAGDSRLGLAAGKRGCELAFFRAASFAASFEKVCSFTKMDLMCAGRTVLSIEGAALHRSKSGLEIFLSSEKDVPYPEGVREYRKPGAGVWSIDGFGGRNLATLDPSRIRNVLSAAEPAGLHVKDPVVFDRDDGGTVMLFCTHPYTWASANSGAAWRRPGATEFERITDCLLPRGRCWDVAVTRVTDRLAVPRLGLFRDLPPLSLYFYDGAECVRPHEQHMYAVPRPRGYSCEEIGGLAWCMDTEFPALQRLSELQPFFVSPHGTGCSRYVHTLRTEEAILGTWQQAQSDGSQPLVGHALPMEFVEDILCGR